MENITALQPLVLPLVIFTALATFTPGPNNIFLTLSGYQHGYRKSLPFIVGIRLGIGLLFILMSSGVGALLNLCPALFFIFKLLGSAYLLYLAFKIARTKFSITQHNSVQLLGWRKGVLLQFVNPKSMLMVLSCITAFSLPNELYLYSIVQAFIVFTLIGTVSNICWVVFGMSIKQYLATEKRHRMFHRSLAVLTIFAIALLYR